MKKIIAIVMSILFTTIYFQTLTNHSNYICASSNEITIEDFKLLKVTSEEILIGLFSGDLPKQYGTMSNKISVSTMQEGQETRVVLESDIGQFTLSVEEYINYCLANKVLTYLPFNLEDKRSIYEEYDLNLETLIIVDDYFLISSGNKLYVVSSNDYFNSFSNEEKEEKNSLVNFYNFAIVIMFLSIVYLVWKRKNKKMLLP